MKVELIEIGRVIPYARNPRRNENAITKVAASIKEYGFRQPIVVDEEMVIIAGHTRLQAAQSLGLKKVPVHIADGLTLAQIKAYRLADNRTHEDAEWDTPSLVVKVSIGSPRFLRKLERWPRTEWGFHSVAAMMSVNVVPSGCERRLMIIDCLVSRFGSLAGVAGCCASLHGAASRCILLRGVAFVVLDFVFLVMIFSFVWVMRHIRLRGTLGRKAL
jgi:hypothetical protein